MSRKDPPSSIPGPPSDTDELTTAVPAAIPFGKYELIQCIATGGMGEVFLAREAGSPGYDRVLVIKVLLPHLSKDPEFVRLFLDEARIASQLNHPNIAAIFDLGQNDGTIFLAMEYVHGESLEVIDRQAAGRDRKVPLKILARIVAQAAAGLHYAHNATDPGGRPLRIIHRDISPQNVLVGFDGVAKIIDFGIAKAVGRSSQTRVGVVRGKIPYMSPEQAAGLRIDQRTDVFALGVVFFELATGKVLFPYTNDLKTLATVTRCEVPRPSTLEPDIDPALDAIMLKALAKDPVDRYQTADELRAALEEWLTKGGEMVPPTLLAAFMGELFNERLELERQEGRRFTSARVVPSEIFSRPAITAHAPLLAPPAGASAAAAAAAAAATSRTQPAARRAPRTDPPSPSTADVDAGALRWAREIWQWLLVAVLAMGGGWLVWQRSGVGALPPPEVIVVEPVDEASDAGADDLEPAVAVVTPPVAPVADAGTVLRPAPRTKVDEAYEDAIHLFTEKRWVAAARQFQKVVDAEPGRANAHLLLGTCNARLRRSDEAARHYEEFVRLAPNDPMTPNVQKLLKAYYARQKRKK